MIKKYQVFISSTYTDLQEERAAVTQCLLDMNCIPVGMEQFPASNMEQMEYIKKMLADCDYYILILAGRYGSCDESGMGYTEKEYDYAIEHNIPVMTFVVEDLRKLLMEKCEKDDEGRRKLLAFREKVSRKKLRKTYTNIDSLKAAVAVSLGKCIQDFPAVGWVRADSVDLSVPQTEPMPLHHDSYDPEIEHMKKVASLFQFEANGRTAIYAPPSDESFHDPRE